MAAPSRRAATASAARGEGAGRPGRRVHAVEFPDQPGGPQDLRRARRRLLDHPQGSGGDAGLLRRRWSMPTSRPAIPAGVVNLVFGVPAEISAYLIPHPIIRKISFTGSTAVGKQLAALAGQHMKRVTMELGGHAPAIVFDDADVDVAAKILSANKFRNAGQVCVSPTRFLVQEPVYEQFVDKFVTAAKAVKVGDGLEDDTRMGPLAHSRRLDAIEGFVTDAVAKGAKLETGGAPDRQQGLFLRADRAHRRAARRAHHERGAVRPGRHHQPVRHLRRGGGGGQPAALRARRLCLHPLGQDRGGDRPRDRERHGVDQPPRPRAARSAASAASRIPATAAKAAPTRSTPISTRSSSRR